MKHFRKRTIVLLLVLSTLVANLVGVYARLIDENSGDYFNGNTIRIIEVGVDEGDKKLAYLLGDSSHTNLDYDKLLKNPDDLRKYRELVGNFELSGGTNVAINYISDVPADTAEEDIKQQKGYLEKVDSNSDFDYVSKFYTNSSLSSSDVYLGELQLGYISDFDFSKKYRQEVITSIYQESATGNIIKIGDNYYDLNADFCKVYKDSTRTDEYVLSEITADDNVIITIYDHTVYEGVWSGITRYVVTDCFTEDANGDYICINNTGYTLLSDYTKKSAVLINESNKDSLASDDVVVYRNSKQIYRGSWASLTKSTEDGGTYIYLNNMWYSLTDVNAYCIFNYSSTYSDIVLLKDNDINYIGAEDSLTRYKENFDNIFKLDENGSYIKFNNTFYSLEDLYCKFTIDSEEVKLPLLLYKSTDTYDYFKYIVSISDDETIIDESKKDLYIKWKFVPATSGLYYSFDLDMCDWYSEGEITTDKYDIWEGLEETKEYRGKNTKIKYSRPVVLEEDIYSHTSDLSLGLKNMLYKTSDSDKFAWIDDDVEIYYEFYTYNELTYSMLKDKVRNVIYFDSRNDELHDLYEKYSKNEFESKEVNNSTFSLNTNAANEILYKYRANKLSRADVNNVKNNSIVCFDGDFYNINLNQRLTSLQYLYFTATAGHYNVLDKYDLLNSTKDGYIINSLLDDISIKMDCPREDFEKYLFNNVDGNPFAGHFTVNLDSGSSIATLSNVPNNDLSQEVYDYAGVDSLTYRDAIGVMLNTIPKSTLGNKTIRILEIEPSTAFIGGINYNNESSISDYNDQNKKYWYSRIYGIDPNFNGSVEVTRMSINELITSSQNLYDSYDIIYIGSKYNNLTHTDFPYKDVNETYNMYLYGQGSGGYPRNSKSTYFISYKEFGFVGDIESVKHPNSDTNLLGHTESWHILNNACDDTKFFYKTQNDDTMPYGYVKRIDGVNDKLYNWGTINTQYGKFWEYKNFYYGTDGIYFNDTTNANKATTFDNIPLIINSKLCYLNCRVSLTRGESSNTRYFGLNKDNLIELGRYFWGNDTDSYNGYYSILDYDESLINAEMLSNGRTVHISVTDPVNAFTTKIKVRVIEDVKGRTPNLIKLRHNQDGSPLTLVDGKFDLSNTIKEDISFDSTNYVIVDNKLYSKDDSETVLGLVISQNYTEDREVTIKYDGDNRGITDEVKITTRYNDSSMDGKLYTHLGDSLLVGGASKSLFNYCGLTNRTAEVSDSEQGLVYKEFDKTRFSGSDLTETKYNELLNYLLGGKPIIASSKFYNSNGDLNLNTLDVNSYMCKLLTNNSVKEDFTLNVDDVLGSLNNSFTLKILDQPRRYMDVSKEGTRWGVYLPESGNVDEFDLWHTELWNEYSRDVSTGKLTSINLPSNIVIPQGTRKLRFNSDSDLFNFTFIWVNRVDGNGSYSGTRINDVNLIHNSNEDGVIGIPRDMYHSSYNDYYADGFSLVISLRDPSNSPGDTLDAWMKAIMESNTSICTGDTLEKGVLFPNYVTSTDYDNTFIPYSDLGIETAPDSDEEKQDLFYVSERDLSISFLIEAKDGTYSSNLALEEISDGVFNNDEGVTNINIVDSNGRNVDSNNLLPNTEYTLYFTLNDNIIGLNHWQLKITKNGSNNLFSKYDNYFAIKASSESNKETLKILQILPSTESINGINTSTSNFVNLDLTRNSDFIEYCKSLKDFNVVVVSATENSDNDYYKLKTSSNVLGNTDLIPSDNNGLLPKLENCNYHGTVDALDEEAISKEWCTYFYDLFGLDYTADVGMHISDFDMIVFGFAKDKVYVESNTLLNTIDDFVHSGGSIVVSNDVINYNNSNSSKTALSKYFKSKLCQDRFGVSQPSLVEDLDNYINNVTDDKVVKFTNAASVLGYDYCTNVNKGSFEGIEGLSDSFILNCQNVDTTEGLSQNKVYDDTIYNGISSSTDMFNTTNKLSCNNTGQINNYPFYIPEDIKISATHSPYYQLNLDNDLSVWYSLDYSNTIGNSDDTLYTDIVFNQVRGLDGRNNYYVYTKDNITYTGLGNSSDITKDEMKLFVNTVIMSYRKSAKSPDLYIRNENAINAGDSAYIYLDSDISDISKVLDSQYSEGSKKSLIICCELDDKNIIVNKDNYVQVRVLDANGNYVNVPVNVYSVFNPDLGVDSNSLINKASNDLIDSIPINVLEDTQYRDIFVLGDKSKFFIEINLDTLLNCYNNSQTLSNEQSFTLPLECWIFTSYGNENYKSWIKDTHSIKIVKRDLFDIE